MAVTFNRPAAKRIIRGVRTVEGGNVRATSIPRNPRHPRSASGIRLFRFALTGSWSSGVANADIKQMDGTAVESDSVSDPEGIFSTLASGDTGLCLKQGGTYFAIQAPCPA